MPVKSTLTPLCQGPAEETPAFFSSISWEWGWGDTKSKKGEGVGEWRNDNEEKGEEGICYRQDKPLYPSRTHSTTGLATLLYTSSCLQSGPKVMSNVKFFGGSPVWPSGFCTVMVPRTSSTCKQRWHLYLSDQFLLARSVPLRQVYAVSAEALEEQVFLFFMGTNSKEAS